MKKIFTLATVLFFGACGVSMAQDVTVSLDSIPAVPFDEAAPAEETKADASAVVAEEEDLFADEKEDYGASIAKTWEYRVFGTANTTSGTSSITSDESAGLELGVGYNVTSWFYAGITTGFIHDFGGTSGMDAGDIIPWLVDLQLRWNVKRKLSIFVEGRTGVFCNVTPDVTTAKDNNGKETKFSYPNYMYYEVQPGLLFRITEKFDVRLSFGYGYAKPYNETTNFEGRTYDETVLTGKFGIAYRFR